MKIAIPTADKKLCAHFGHCEIFSFAEVNEETNEITKLYTDAPEGGVSCQSAGWLAGQSVDVVLAGGMGERPMMVLEQSGIKVITGCPELPIQEVVELYLKNELKTGENSCGHDDHHNCHGGHGEHHHCGHH